MLTEADRIGRKHLLTLETTVSAAQTAEMETKGLQLVVPRALHPTYSEAQRSWLLDLGSFMEVFRTKA